MSGPFDAELAQVHAAILRTNPKGAGIYALPWYLVLGEPGAGRTTALRSMGLGWPLGEGPLPLGASGLVSYWLTAEAVFVEPEAPVVGPARGPDLLRQLGDALWRARPREPVDGVLLTLAVTDFVDLDEQGLSAYAGRMRGALSEVAGRLRADVPVYVMVTRFDTLWGFGAAFQWGPERREEEPWGFLLPGDLPIQKLGPAIQSAMAGLGARFEAFCLSRLSLDDPPGRRAAAFQHLAEVRAMMAKLGSVLDAIGTANAFERAPWIRALAIGSAVPGVGDRPRVGAARFRHMGLGEPARLAGPTERPGGLPLYRYLRSVVLPEREIVPLRVRWRDDRLVVAPFVLAMVVWLAVAIVAVVSALR